MKKTKILTNFDNDSNMPIKYASISASVKVIFFSDETLVCFQFVIPENIIMCVQGGSNEYPLSMFKMKNKQK